MCRTTVALRVFWKLPIFCSGVSRSAGKPARLLMITPGWARKLIGAEAVPLWDS